MRNDIRYAFRALWKDPGFAVPAVLALALSIGANTSVFTVVKSVLLAPLQMRRPEQLVSISQIRPNGQQWPFNLPYYLDLRERSRAFEEFSALSSWNVNLTGEANPERLLGARVTGNYFTMLGVEAALGRTIVPDDAKPGSPKVAVLTWKLWQRRYGARREIVGTSLKMNGEPFTVIGVLPASFTFRSSTNEFAVPYVIETDPFRDQRASTATLRVYARLKGGTTQSQAAADLTRIAAEFRRDFPKESFGITNIAAASMQEELTGASRDTLSTLMWAVGLVLLIACTNVSSLLVAKASGRRREMAIRAAMGGTRWQMTRQFLMEGVMLSLAGGLLGFVLAGWGVQLLLAISPAELPRSAEIRLDSTILACALAATVACGLFLGIFPAFQVSYRNLTDGLRGEGRSSTASRSRATMRSALVVLEVALSLVLLTGAGLMLKSFQRLTSLDPGYQAEGLLTMRLGLPATRYRGTEAIATFHDRLRERLRALPGVTEVGAVNILPLSGPLASSDFTIVGQPPLTEKEKPTANYRMIDPGYFRAMGSALVRGRNFTEADDQRGRNVVIVSEALEKAYWKGRDAIGTHVLMQDAGPTPRDAEVIGVARGMREVALDQPATASIYVPIPQVPPISSRFLTNNFFWAVRTSAITGTQLRKEVGAVDADIAVAEMTMDEYLQKGLGRHKFSLRMLMVFAIAALLLAGSGLYALIAYSTAQRTREMGIRLAMGARLSNVAGLVVRQALGLAISGVILGTVAAWVAAKLIAPLLFDVSPHDSLTFSLAGIAMVVVAGAASYAPARRAGRVDPMMALRSE
jgi:putative ABC transport system permease protein